MRRNRVLLLAAVAAVLTGSGPTWAERHHYYHRSTTCTRCCLRAHRYQHDNVRGRAIVLVAAQAEGQANLRPPTIGEETIRSKRFPLQDLAVLQADPVSLSKIGLSMYSTGEAICSGMLDHNGGPDANLQGNHVTIRLRGYAGLPQAPGVEDAPVVWEMSVDAWARRNQPRLVRFGTSRPDDGLRRFFSEITHVELELQYTRDR